MNDYVGTLSKHRRLTILKFLLDSPEYTSNASIMVEVCNTFGVTSTRDQVAGEVAWLKEQGMVTFEDHGDFIVVTATTRGVEIAQGKARHDGVQRPRPGV
ncbi:hypothetical protein GTA62_13000 [Roseobacter sp. HKCCD9010]|uniref:VpaChn25_0724 family phage protein n=1 Tax=unclassified Roseobacter TaxID=196798 RepID=UPI001491A1C0|nr:MULTISPECIES: hypothetical protein [unclassified Roseobacter]MBF9049898.1 hypothetical protein [Rhodobacterales bacterium HKCCD4356]NNV13563.1 hypothetical protein [Roseobacter sp. HKCCD7357]NNV16397.1 hypothetical protein [Roseobacter sp. HKCCD8768]NNV25856.1 hypothetical protein [Roseobacter sp. HKCCD8192]NNV30114.1 hypothetical protein [Roseobacter sp. HKCCD9061]